MRNFTKNLVAGMILVVILSVVIADGARRSEKWKPKGCRSSNTNNPKDQNCCKKNQSEKKFKCFEKWKDNKQICAGERIGTSKAKVDYQQKLIDGKLESFETRMDTHRWAINAALTGVGFIVTLLAAGVVFVTFKQSKEYEKALNRAEKAAEKAERFAVNTEKLEKQAKNSLDSIDTKVEKRLKEIEEKGDKIEDKGNKKIKNLIQEAEKQRRVSGRVNELWGKAMKAAKDEDFELASSYFDKTDKELDSKDEIVLNNLGNSLSNWANEKDGNEADKLFALACEKYDKAAQIKTDDHEVFFSWGSTLSKWADKKDGDEAVKLFALACEKYDKATQIKTDKYKAFNNWGTALTHWAFEDSDEADKLFTLACEKYDKATQIKTDFYEAFDNWGAALLYLAIIKGNEERLKLLEQAKEKCLIAESFKTGSGAYNLACVYALLGDEGECEKWLKLGEQTGTLPKRKHAEDDHDLDSVRNKAWFKKIRWKDDPPK